MASAPEQNLKMHFQVTSYDAMISLIKVGPDRRRACAPARPVAIELIKFNFFN